MKNELIKLSKSLTSLGRIEEAYLILKWADENIYLYSYVPTKDLDLVFEYGLASSRYIKENEELLCKIFPNKKERKKWEDKFDKDDITLQGPSVWFSKPDLKKIKKIDPDHPLLEDDFTLIKIDYTALKKAQPNLKIQGLELIPYEDEEYDKLKNKIEKKLTKKEIVELSEKNFKETWKDEIPGEGFYSANVPHGILINKEGYIPPQFLEVVK